MEEFQFFGVFFMTEGRMEQRVDRQSDAASKVMWSLLRSVKVKKALSRKTKLSIYWSISVSMVTSFG